MKLLRECIRELLAEDATKPTIKVQNYGNGISVVLMMSGFKIGYVTAREVLRWKHCAKDVERLQAQGIGKVGIMPDFPTLGPNLWAVGNSQVDQEFRGLGYGKMLYEKLIEEIGNQSSSRGAFVGADMCTGGSTSKGALGVWRSLARDYPSSGNVVYVGPK